MDTRLLTTFVYVAELASHPAVLRWAMPSLRCSFQIKQLEAELGAKLFERINHTVGADRQWPEVLQYAHRINQLSEEMLRSVRQEKRPAGHIRLAAADSLCPMLLGTPFLEFRRRYPDVSVKVIAAETSEMYWMLDHNVADLVLTLDSHIYKAEYVIAGEEKVRAHFVAAPDHPLARRQEVDVRELLQEPFMLTGGHELPPPSGRTFGGTVAGDPARAGNWRRVPHLPFGGAGAGLSLSAGLCNCRSGAGRKAGVSVGEGI